MSNGIRDTKINTKKYLESKDKETDGSGRGFRQKIINFPFQRKLNKNIISWHSTTFRSSFLDIDGFSWDKVCSESESENTFQSGFDEVFLFWFHFLGGTLCQPGPEVPSIRGIHISRILIRGEMCRMTGKQMREVENTGLLKTDIPKDS